MNYEKQPALAKAYDGWYQAGAAHWEDAPGKTVLIAALKSCCHADRPLRLLDIGCGTGSFLGRIHAEVSAEWDLHGVDLSPVAIGLASQRYPSFHLTAGDGTFLDFAPGAFDIVTCYGSWEHFEKPELAIAEAGRLLIPGGRLFAMIPALGIHRTDREDEGWYEDTDVAGSDFRQMQWNLRRETWAAMMENAGIQILDNSLALKCGANKPGVFFFGVKLPTGP